MAETGCYVTGTEFVPPENVALHKEFEELQAAGRVQNPFIKVIEDQTIDNVDADYIYTVKKDELDIHLKYPIFPICSESRT